MTLFLMLFPAVLAGLAMLVASNRWRPWLLPLAGTVHLAGVAWLLWSGQPDTLAIDMLTATDAPGRLVLLLLSSLFALCAWYSVGYLRQRTERDNRIFCTCLLAFLSTTTLVCCSQHLGVMWVAIEATTLATAPLIYFNKTQRSIEATWKYLLIGSVGIALSLLGSFFLAYAAVGQHAGAVAAGNIVHEQPSMVIDKLLQQAHGLSIPWLKAAFVLLLVGYGTKMGLAPMHSWKPDAYGEAPGVVGALLAGGLTSCAFLILLRVHHVCAVAGVGAYTDRLLVFMGLVSMAVAGAFMVAQRDFKRMLAYSSVEHMGILVLGLGLSGMGGDAGKLILFGVLLHMLNNGITKGVLFLAAANIHRAYGDKTTDVVKGAMRRLPLSGTMFLLGFFAITGSPPFGPFVSEFTILSGAFAGGRYIVAGLFLLFLFIVFLGMGRTVLAVVQGRPPSAVRKTPYHDGLLTGLPILLSGAVVLLLGIHIPAPLRQMLEEAVKFLEVHP